MELVVSYCDGRRVRQKWRHLHPASLKLLNGETMSGAEGGIAKQGDASAVEAVMAWRWSVCDVGTTTIQPMDDVGIKARWKYG
jgi:hypothetical protein